MPTKAELEALVAVLQAEVEKSNKSESEAVAKLEACQDELMAAIKKAEADGKLLKTLEAEIDKGEMEFEALEAKMAKLQEQLTTAEGRIETMGKIEAPMPPAFPYELQSLGRIAGVGNTIAVGNVHTLNTKWKSAQATRSKVAVDFIGPNAHQLATRQPNLAPKPIPGGFRLECPNLPQASSIAKQADRLIVQNAMTGNTVTVASMGASSFQCSEAAGNGAGIATTEGAPAWAALKAASVNVSAVKKNGEVVGLFLRK